MDEAGKRTETGRMEATPISLLSTDTITDILLRLPAKSVLCAGAVCKAWRGITTKTSFVTQHSRRQPTNVILYTYLFSPQCKDLRPGFTEDELALELLPISSSSSSDDDDEAARRRLIRYPKEITFLLLASCNGVLLFRKSCGSFLLCNPTTSRWAELSQLPDHDTIDEFAFYYHEPSGEYRFLVRRQHRWWFILSTGATEPRKVNLGAWLAEDMGITSLLRTTPVALKGRLHWPPHQAKVAGAPAAAAAAAGETGTSTTKMVVFDTLLETFHQMPGPPTPTADQTKVFDMEGRLVAADFGDVEHVDLWFLDDDNAGRWQRRHRAPTPWHTGIDGIPVPEGRLPKYVAAAGSGDDREGDVILGNRLGLLVYSLRTRTARTIDSVAASQHNVVVSRHVFRESLEQHRSFAVRSAAELGVNFSWH